MRVNFFTATEYPAGGVWLLFTSTAVQYFLYGCTISFANFPTNPPSSSIKIWKITLNKTPEIRIKIRCNGIEVLNMLLSERTCTRASWSSYWERRDLEKIRFSVVDNASHYYGPCNLGTQANTHKTKCGM